MRICPRVKLVEVESNRPFNRRPDKGHQAGVAPQQGEPPLPPKPKPEPVPEPEPKPKPRPSSIIPTKENNWGFVRVGDKLKDLVTGNLYSRAEGNKIRRERRDKFLQSKDP